MRREIESFLLRLRRDQSGALTILVALATVILLGFAAISVDAGYVVYVRNNLQNSANAAALAGAANIPKSQGVATATSYSAVAGDNNAMPAVLNVTMMSGYPQLQCLASTKAPCIGTPAANAIVVKQQATVPLFFARALGFSTMTLTATATAGAFGGSTPPLDVMIILDTTASMNSGDTSCGAGETRIGCAVKGVQTLLAELQSASAWVGLMVFPGVTSATVGDEYCSPKGTVKTVAYNATSPAPVYQIIGNSTSLSTDYNTSGKSGLNSSSNLVGAVGGASSCTGVQAIGGYGTYYPDVIAQAQSTLVAVSAARLASTGQQAQNVIIFVSDGDAGAASGSYPAGDPTLFKATGDCQMAVNEAKTVATAGTWVYAVAYGSPTAPAPTSCATDKPPMSACLAMQEIASDATKFYSDAQGVTGGCSSASNGALSSLQNIFTYIGNGLATARLIPNGTT